MVEARCVKKYRDNSNKITGYLIQDGNGITRDISPYELKYLMLTKKLDVINLKVTADDRIVDDNSYNKTENIKERIKKLAAMITKDTGIQFNEQLNVVKRNKKDVYVEASTKGKTKLIKIALTNTHNVIRVAYLTLNNNHEWVNAYKHVKYDINGYSELLKLIR